MPEWSQEALKTIESLKEQHQKAVKGSKYDLDRMKFGLTALELQVTLMSLGEKNDRSTGDSSPPV